MVRDRASPGDVASSDGILAIAGRHRVGDIWTATGSSSRARSQSEKMINLNPRRSAGPCLGIRQRMRSAAHSDAIIPFARAGSNSFNDSIIGFIGDRRSHGHRRHAMPRTILRKSLRRWCSWRPTSRLNSFTAQGMLPTVSRRTLSCRLVDFAASNTVQAQRAQFMASSEASN
jgi:hypothetical protein